LKFAAIIYSSAIIAMKIIICPIAINDTTSIMVKNEVFDRAFPDLIKQIKGSYYSKATQSWLIPYTKKAFIQAAFALGRW